MDSINTILKRWQPFHKITPLSQHIRRGNRSIANPKCDCGFMKKYLDSFIAPNGRKHSSILWYLDNFFDDVQCCNKAKAISDEQAYEVCCKLKRPRKAKKKHLDIDTPPIPIAPWKPMKGTGLMHGRRYPFPSHRSFYPTDYANQPKKSTLPFDCFMHIRRPLNPLDITIKNPWNVIGNEEQRKKFAFPFEDSHLRRSSKPQFPTNWTFEQRRKKQQETEIWKLYEIDRLKRLKEEKQQRNLSPTVESFPEPVHVKLIFDVKENKEDPQSKQSNKLRSSVAEKTLIRIADQKTSRKKDGNLRKPCKKAIAPFGIYDFEEKTVKPQYTHRFHKMLRKKFAINPELHPILESRFAMHDHIPYIQLPKPKKKIGNIVRGKQISNRFNKQKIKKKENPFTPLFGEMVKDLKKPEDHPKLKSMYHMAFEKQRKPKLETKSKLKTSDQFHKKVSIKKAKEPKTTEKQVIMKEGNKEEIKSHVGDSNYSKTFRELLHGKVIKKPELLPQLKTKHNMDISKTHVLKEKDKNSPISRNVVSGLPSYRRNISHQPRNLDFNQQSMLAKALELGGLKKSKPKTRSMFNLRDTFELESSPQLQGGISKIDIRKIIKSGKKSKGLLKKISPGSTFVPKMDRVSARLGEPSTDNQPSSMFTPDRFPSQLSKLTLHSRDTMADLSNSKMETHIEDPLRKGITTSSKETVKQISIKEDDNVNKELPLPALRKFSSYIKNSAPDRRIVKRIGSKNSISYLRSTGDNSQMDLDNNSLFSSHKFAESATLIGSTDTLLNYRNDERYMYASDYTKPQNSTDAPIRTNSLSLEELARENERKELIKREIRNYTKQEQREMFTMQQREKLNEQILLYLELCEEYKVKKPKHHPVTEPKLESNTVKKEEEYEMPVKEPEHAKEKDENENLNQPTTLRRASNCALCNCCRIGYRVPELRFMKQMKEKWQKVELSTYYRLMQQREREMCQKL